MVGCNGRCYLNDITGGMLIERQSNNNKTKGTRISRVKENHKITRDDTAKTPLNKHTISPLQQAGEIRTARKVLLN